MCVIIHRKPGATIPFDMLKSACHVNADGFGLLIPDRGKLEMRRVFNPKGNSPDNLAKLLEDAKDLTVYAHLRYQTKGTRNLTNVHPFTVANIKRDGIDVQFMHNGTLSEFGTSDECDSRVFARDIIRPLYDMVANQVGHDKALYNPLFAKLLSKYAGTSSVFTLVDSKGNSLTINQKKGYDFAWGWASNQYSFERDHRETSAAKTYYGSYPVPRGSVQTTGSTGSAVSGSSKEFNDELPFEANTKTTSTKKGGQLPSVVGGTNVTASIVSKGSLRPTEPRQTFCDVAGIQSLADVITLAPEDIADLVDEYPEHASLLIQDLITELYDRKAKQKKAA